MSVFFYQLDAKQFPRYNVFDNFKGVNLGYHRGKLRKKRVVGRSHVAPRGLYRVFSTILCFKATSV